MTLQAPAGCCKSTSTAVGGIRNLLSISTCAPTLVIQFTSKSPFHFTKVNAFSDVSVFSPKLHLSPFQLCSRQKQGMG